MYVLNEDRPSKESVGHSYVRVKYPIYFFFAKEKINTMHVFDVHTHTHTHTHTHIHTHKTFILFYFKKLLLFWITVKVFI